MARTGGKKVRLSHTMRAELRSIAEGGFSGETPGEMRFFSGWPTYEALKHRGLVVIEPDPGHLTGWVVRLTAAGWEASGVERPAGVVVAEAEGGPRRIGPIISVAEGLARAAAEFSSTECECPVCGRLHVALFSGEPPPAISNKHPARGIEPVPSLC